MNSAKISATDTKPANSTSHTTPQHYWRNFAAGFAASILGHEAGHVAAAYAIGSHPSLGFDPGVVATLATTPGVRIAHDGHYANFFMRPSTSGGTNVGLAVLPER